MKDRYKVLVVDDAELNIEILMSLLSAEYDILVALSGEEALEIIDSITDVDLILLDVMMPGMDGFEVTKRLKSNDKTKDIPIVFVTAKTDEDTIEKAYDIGGSDYITKPVKPKELFVRVKKELKIKALIHNLENIASTDHLTSLYNRRYFFSIVVDIVNLAKRDKKNISMLMLDIDKFKNINDTYGHQSGDEVIIHLSESLRMITRNSDIACRYGGEEFLILLPNTDADGALKIAEKIRKYVMESRSFLINKPLVNYTVSIGVHELNIFGNQNVEASINKVDQALYIAKKNGRNKSVVI